MKSEEIENQKVYVSPRPPPKISYTDDWMCDLDSDVARSSKDIQRIERKPTTQFIKHGETRLWTRIHKSVACWHLNMLKKIKQVWGDPYWWIKKWSTKLISEYQDCHIQLRKKRNISEFKSFRKRSKIILIEKHFKPICSWITSATRSAKIRRRWSANWAMWSYSSCANLFQCSHYLLYWNQGIVYCTCGQCLIHSESRRILSRLRLDALSIPNYVIKKGPTHGARHGKTEEQTEYHMAWNA